MAHSEKHGVPLITLFILLLLFTAAEIVLYEVWRTTEFIPKFAMVLILLFVLTLPKAFMVMTYFMHLKFERIIIVTLALVPLVFVGILILPIMTDIRTLSERNHTHAVGLGDFTTHAEHGGEGNHEAGGDHADEHEDEAHEEPDAHAEE